MAISNAVAGTVGRLWYRSRRQMMPKPLQRRSH